MNISTSKKRAPTNNINFENSEPVHKHIRKRASGPESGTSPSTFNPKTKNPKRCRPRNPPKKKKKIRCITYRLHQCER